VATPPTMLSFTKSLRVISCFFISGPRSFTDLALPGNRGEVVLSTQRHLAGLAPRLGQSS
jgi:hypothetical protein